MGSPDKICEASWALWSQPSPDKKGNLQAMSAPKTIRLIHTIRCVKGFEEFVVVEGSKTTALTEITGLSSINMFVGANNSGKSRMLRALSQIEQFEIQRSDYEPEATGVKYDDLCSPLRLRMTLQQYSSLGGLEAHNSDMPKVKEWLAPQSSPGSYIRETLTRQTNDPKLRQKSGSIAELDSFELKLVDNFGTALTELVSQIPPETLCSSEPKRVYIPSLRGLRPFSGSAPYNDLYQERTVTDYFSDDDGAHVHRPDIFTGIGVFTLVRKMLLSRREKRSRVREYEERVSLEFFGGKSFSLTPHETEGVLHVQIGEVEMPIHHLGDGMQSLILLTLHAHLYQDEPTLYFIEEPEIYLHPGLQRQLMEFFASIPNHLYFFTTHSNHLLDMSADFDVSVYTFKPDSPDENGSPRFLVQQVSNGDRSSLELLGVRNSSVFLVNATVWVEGITDRLYLRQFLKMYAASDEAKNIPILREDTDYAIVEYGGAAITHWSFLDSDDDDPAPIGVDTLCGAAFVLLDRDDREDGKEDRKSQRLSQLRAKLGDDQVGETDGREIENDLPAAVIASVVRSFNETDGDALQGLTRAEYRAEKMGEFLDTKLGSPSRKGGYGDTYGALKSKTKFAKRAVKELEGRSFSELPEETRKLVQNIYEFITSRKV